MNYSFIQDAEGCNWLSEKLPADHPAFNSALIRGNEDSPEFVTLWVEVDPLETDQPAARYEQCQITGNLIKK